MLVEADAVFIEGGNKSATAASGVFGANRMSCSPCCCVAPQDLLDGIRTRSGSGAWRSGRDTARLVTETEEEVVVKDEEEEKEIRNNMDISVLREQYRCSRESQKRCTQVLLFRRVSQELSDALSIIPVPQGFISSSEPQNCLPLANNNPKLLTSDPWHVHLGLHRRSCQRVTNQITPDMTNTNSSFRCLSPSSESDSRDGKLSGDSTTDSLSRSSETFTGTKSHINCPTGDPVCDSFNCPTEDPVCDSFNSPIGDPVCDSFNCPTGGPVRDSFSCPTGDVLQASLDGSLEVSPKNPGDCSEDDHLEDSVSTSQECSAAGSLTSSDESSTPVASVTCSPNSSSGAVDDELKKKKENVAANGKTSDGILQDSRRSSIPALRFTRQMSFGGVGSSQHQNYYPFPHRKTQRISEAARRLGMYSSF